MRLIYCIPAATAILLSTVACNKPEVDLTRVSVGMSKEEVTKLLGKPTRVAVNGRTEYFEYEAYDKASIGFAVGIKQNIRQLFVRFIDGRVDSFGKKGDFDSTKNPTTEQKIDLKVTGGATTGTSNTQPAEKFDLASELKKLDQMKKEGLLTEDEYKSLRQRAIDKAKAQ